MKQKMLSVCAAALVSALCAGFVACEKPTRSDAPIVDRLNPYANCWVYVTTSQGEEKILFAKGMIPTEESSAYRNRYEDVYGDDGNFRLSVSFANGINDNGLDYLATNPDAVTNCYEFTMTVDLAEFAAFGDRLREKLLDYGMCGVRIIDGVAICKRYDWAFTDERAKELIVLYESEFDEYFSPLKISATSVKKLGPEVHNKSIF